MHRPFPSTVHLRTRAPMRPIIRAVLRACAAALLPCALAAPTETRVAAHAGMLPFTALHAAAQVEVTPGGGGVSYFAEYNRWAWGMICVEEIGGSGSGRGCPQTGHSLHAGVTHRLGRAGARWRPYLSGAAGAARVLDVNEESRPVQLSLGVEGGYDVGGAGPIALRLGARWQGRPQVGTDYLGPIVGFRLRL
jgi:hypothetical protein